MPMLQLSSVMTWNSVYSERPSVPNQSGKLAPNSLVVITAKT